MVSFRLDSPYFAGNKKLTLHIIGAAWLDKGHGADEINLAEKQQARCEA